MRELYPELEKNFHKYLETDSNKIYYEESGNPNGIPVIFLHGGPGSGCNDNHRRYFNPSLYRIILMDQRGCNRSSPSGSTVNNTTQEILSDIDTIRQILHIDKWLLFGGSWGATLALLYAETYPNNVQGIILRGSFLAREQDLRWFIDGVTRLFPDYWNDLINEYSNKVTLIDDIAKDIFSDDKTKQLKAAKAWSLWAGRIVTSSITDNYVLEVEDENKLINDVKIEMHFATNRYFVTEDEILHKLKQIPNIPISIIHGRRDYTCLIESSYTLHKSLPNSEFTLLANAGHLGGEPDMIDALITATDLMADKLS